MLVVPLAFIVANSNNFRDSRCQGRLGLAIQRSGPPRVASTSSRSRTARSNVGWRVHRVCKYTHLGHPIRGRILLMAIKRSLTYLFVILLAQLACHCPEATGSAVGPQSLRQDPAAVYLPKLYRRGKAEQRKKEKNEKERDQAAVGERTDSGTAAARAQGSSSHASREAETLQGDRR